MGSTPQDYAQASVEDRRLMATDWERACFALAETLYHHSGLQDEFADRFLALVEKWPPKEEGPGPRPDPADGDAGGGPGAGPSSKPGAGPFTGPGA